MKLLLFIFGITAAVIGDPVPSTLLTEDGLKSIAENLLREVGGLKNELSQIERNSKAIVKSKIYEIEEVKMLEAEVNKALESGKLPVECAVSIDKRFHNFVASTSDERLRNAVKNITGNKKSLKEHQQVLNEIESVLVTSLDKEIKSCLADQAKCKLTGEFLNVTEGLSKLVDLQKDDIYDSINMSSDDLASKGLQDKVTKEIIEPSQKCLKA